MFVCLYGCRQSNLCSECSLVLHLAVFIQCTLLFIFCLLGKKTLEIRAVYSQEYGITIWYHNTAVAIKVLVVQQMYSEKGVMGNHRSQRLAEELTSTSQNVLYGPVSIV